MATTLGCTVRFSAPTTQCSALLQLVLIVVMDLQSTTAYVLHLPAKTAPSTTYP